MNEVGIVICEIVDFFTKHKISYFVGGSLSSSLNGIFRSTNDIDIILENVLTKNILKDLENNFIIDTPALLESHSRNRAYNIFHKATSLKLDLFPAHNEFHTSQLSRAILVKLPSAPCSFNIASPEDIILAKLIWFKKSSSDRQLSDIKGVIGTNEGKLDLGYLNLWAEKLDVLKELNFLF